MRVLFLHCARDWSGTARALAVAARGLAARGYNVAFLAEPHSNVEQSASRMAMVAQKLAGDDPTAARDIAPFDLVPFSGEGHWLAVAWRLRHLFRRWDADVVFVHTAREHLIASVACWLGRSGKLVRRTAAGLRLEMDLGSRVAGWLTGTTYLFSSAADVRSADLPKTAKSAIAPLGVDVSRYPNRPAAATEPKPEDIRYIICVYDPTSRGRAATAIRTVSMLAPRHPYLRLIIFGAGSDSEDLRMQAAALDVMHLVSFLG
ncbi:MAG TPA: glycosyltransferase, partial [Gemmatimonadaceae bacterium]|nr:glycosyltransferase [Gemmatimonadaceae bacterium]